MTAILTLTGVFILAYEKPPPVAWVYLTLISIDVFIPNRNRAAKKINGETQRPYLGKTAMTAPAKAPAISKKHTMTTSLDFAVQTHGKHARRN